MSTTNFTITNTMEILKFPLMVMSNEMLYREYNEDFDEEEFANSDLWFEWNMLKEDIEEEFEELKNKLYTLEIELKDGYYSGVQFLITTKDLDYRYIEVNECDDWDEWELQNYFNADTIEEAKKNLNEEVIAIKTFLENMKNYGFREVNLVAVFSNGEGVYEWAD